MKVTDLGLGPTTQGLNIDTSIQSTNHHRILFFNFISLRQLDSQKIRYFSIVASFFCFLQNVYISFWPYLNLTAKEIKNRHDYIREPIFFEENITNALFFYTTEESDRIQILISFIIFFLSIFFFLLSLICFCLYFFKHIVNFQLILCFNFFVNFICPIIAIPLSFQIGFLISHVNILKEIEEEGREIFIIIIILDVILYIIVISNTLICNIFNAHSIIIVEYYFLSKSGLFQSYLTLFPSVTLFLSYVLPLFHSNLRYLVISLHMLYCVSIVIWSFWIPFAKVRYNGFISSVSLSMLVSDILCFTDYNTNWYRYIIFIVSFFFFLIIMNTFIKLRIKLLLKKGEKKEKKEENNFSENSEKVDSSEKFQLFGDPSPQLTGYENFSVSKCLFVLRIAIIMKSQVFLDGRLLDMLAAKVESDEDKIQLAFLICYFHDYQSIFFALLTSLKRAKFLPLLREFQLFQLRCYDICCHPSSAIEGIEEIIRETSILEVYLRSYWQIIDSECSSYEEARLKIIGDENIENLLPENFKMKANLFSQFDRLSRAIYSCQSKWIALISLYPNNIQVADEYTKFLINCHGDFIGASEWKTVSCLIQDGKTYKFNPAQVSFLRAFPSYVKQVIPKSSLIKGFDDIEFIDKVENIENLIEMPEARFEFQRSVNSAYPISISIFIFLSIFSFLFILVFWIYGICCFSKFEMMIESIYYLMGASLLSQQISINFISGIMDYGTLPDIDIFPSQNEIFSTIFSNGFNDRIGNRFTPSLIPLNDDYKTNLYDVAELSVEIINYLRNSVLLEIENKNDFQFVLDVFYNHSVQSDYYISKDEPILSTSNLQSLLISHIVYYFSLSVNESYDFIDDPGLYHAVSAGDIVINTLDEVAESVLKCNEKILNSNKFTYSGGIYILTAVYILFSVVFVWITFYFIRRSFVSIMSSLCHFPKNVKQKAICSIIKKDENSSSNENIDDLDVKNLQFKIKNVVLIALIISTLIHFVLGGCIFYFHFIDDKYKSNFISITQLSHYYSLETSKAVEVLYSLMAANTFGKIIPAVDRKYKDKVALAIKDFVRIHQQCWNYSVQGDCGIKGEYLKAINDLKSKEKCPQWTNKTYHELIACLAEEPAVNAFIDLTNTLIGRISDPNLFKTDQFKQYIHFVLAHLYYDIQNFAFLLSMGAENKKNDFVTIIDTFGGMSILVAFALFIWNIYIYIKIRDIFKLLFAFISRVLPSDLITNNYLLSELLGIKMNNKSLSENSEVSFLVQESSTPIVFLDRTTLIEFVNNAFTRTFGYEANFIVGQKISALIDDESILFYLDTLKFFETKKCEVKTILCKKGNGNKALFEITFIPIHSTQKEKHDSHHKKEELSDDSDDSKSSFINRIALVFSEKTSKLNLEKKCQQMKSLTDKIMKTVFPEIINLYIDGHLKMCAICIIKFQNSFSSQISYNRVLQQRQNMYELLHERLKIYPLLAPLDCKNGLFTIVACKKNDPTELAIECLSFVFNICDELSITKDLNSNMILRQFFAVVETDGEVILGWSGDVTKKTVLTGHLIDRALKVLDYSSLVGTVCVSKKTYECIMQHDYVFNERVIDEEIDGSSSIYSIESNMESIYESTKLARNNNMNESNATNGFTNSFIERLKIEEGFFANNGE